MRIVFPSEGISPVEVPDAHLMAIVRPQNPMVSAPADRLIRDALARSVTRILTP